MDLLYLFIKEKLNQLTIPKSQYNYSVSEVTINNGENLVRIAIIKKSPKQVLERCGERKPPILLVGI